MNSVAKTQTTKEIFQVEPVLQKALIEGRREHTELQEVFKLMGWGSLPDKLKIVIRADVAAMADELRGHYSSCDPFVKKRRERVTYWVSCYSDGICSLETAVDALKVQKL